MDAVIRIPAIGEQFRHHSGRVYFVIAVANKESTNPDYPLTIVYQGYNGNIWSKDIKRFNETMLPTGYANIHEAVVKKNDLKRAFEEGYNMARDKMAHDESLYCWATQEEAWANSDTLEPFEVGLEIKDD